MKRTARIGIIGAGAIGEVHLNALKTVSAARVVALCDMQAERLTETARAHGVERTFTDYREMLRQKDIDAVYVCSPNSFHCKMTIEALEAGKNVFCEKPMALSAAQGRKMVAAAKKSRKILQMGMVMRHGAEAKMLKSFVDKGCLGKVYHMRVVHIRRRGIPGLGRWFTTKRLSGGGGLIDIGVHSIDLAMWLADQWKPLRVSAATYAEFGPRMRNYVYTGMWAGPPDYGGVFDVDDYACALVRFAGNVTMTVEVAWAANAEPGDSIEILGDKGGLRARGAKRATIFTEQNGHIVDLTPQVAEVNPFEAQAVRFVNAVLGREKPAATGEQGLIVMKVLDAVYKSARMRREVAVASA